MAAVLLAVFHIIGMQEKAANVGEKAVKYLTLGLSAVSEMNMSCFVEASTIYWISWTKMRRFCAFKKAALNAYCGMEHLVLPKLCTL